jgi:hypothetical protein
MNIQSARDTNFTLASSDKTVRLEQRQDGCCHIENWFNGEDCDTINPEHRDYIHICDLDEFISQLTELRDKAKEHFKQYK